MTNELDKLKNQYKKGLLKILINLLDESVRDKAKEREKKITENTELYAELGMDSLERYEFGYRVEEETKIPIKDDDVEKLYTLGDYMSYLTGELTFDKKNKKQSKKAQISVNYHSMSYLRQQIKDNPL
jgi:acyl carrier protein